ncbi:MAG: response regulator [Clostridiales bacterium]|uniref:response regulator n=1 Tax=Clostridium sp. N3C TaxID=1776758 RepID=UPI00092E0CB5|nr:response regulator [Clostridium sp. N3C]NLZ48501.1 response regulator [Clostridiales bacterium]SCN22659.1 Alkaline phosphatase synthesis transcriptional regulatory protein PhoP [Clostridium sp. N3C]
MREYYKILIIDDEEETLSALQKNLVLEGFNVTTCNDSVKAIKMIKDEKFHIIITDIVMPKMDGLEVLKFARSYDALTQVIMMTVHSTMELTIQSLELGANDYILKPFKSIDYIIEIINYSIEKLERWKQSIRDIVAREVF